MYIYILYIYIYIYIYIRIYIYIYIYIYTWVRARGAPVLASSFGVGKSEDGVRAPWVLCFPYQGAPPLEALLDQTAGLIGAPRRFKVLRRGVSEAKMDKP